MEIKSEIRRQGAEYEAVEAAKEQGRIAAQMAYQERYRMVSDPLERQSAREFDAGTDFFKIALQSAFVVNGGALVALPALAAVELGKQGEPIINLMRLYPAAIVFIVGFVLAGLAALTGGMDFRLMSERSRDERHYQVAAVNATNRGDPKPERDEAKFAKLDRDIDCWFKVAVLLWATSYLLFVSGTAVLLA